MLTICSNIKQFHSKLHIDNTFLPSTQTGALYYNKTETGNMLLSYSTGSHVDYNFHTKTESDTLLAGILINIGNIELQGWLDIGTSGYTNSQIRCNADVNGYTGYAELRAASSYDVFLDLSATRTDGGWVYLQVNNGDCIQLPGSDNKINIYKDTATSGNLNVGGRILVDGAHLNVQPKSSTSSEALVFDQSFSSGFGSDSHGINVYGRQGGNSHLKFYNGRSGSVCNVLIDGNLDVGASQAQTSIKAYVNHLGHQGNVEIEARWNSQGFIHFNTTNPDGLLLVATKDGLYLYCGLNYYIFYKPTTNASADRLEENGGIDRKCM